MADLTPDEVMHDHGWKVGPPGQELCGFCKALWPCTAYLMAERAKTAEARVTALEAVVREVAKWGENLRCFQCDGVGQHSTECLVWRAVELMEENNDAG